MTICVLPNVPRVLEQDVYLLTMDDYSPHSLLGGEVIGNHVAQWQYAVDLTYRCLASGLWKLLDEDFLSTSEVGDIRGLCIELSRLDPFNLSAEGQPYWLDTLMCAADPLLKIICEYQLDASSGLFREGFFGAIDRQFAMVGCPWSKGCLFPVGMA